jgi:hypothetical protein
MRRIFKLSCCAAIIILFGVPCALIGQNFSWAKQIGGADNQSAKAITVRNNFVYIAGYFENEVDFDPGPGVYTLSATFSPFSFISADIFIAKYDASGNFIWARQFKGSGGMDVSNAVKVDASGNVYTTGSYADSADFDPGIGVYKLAAGNSGYSQNIFISKLDANGNFVWAKTVSQADSANISNSTGYSLVLDPSGNILVTGTFAGIIDFDPGVSTTTLNSGTGQDIFTLKLDNAGNFSWVRHFPGLTNGSYHYGLSIVPDAVGNIYMTGSFNDVVDFDPGAGVYTVMPVRGTGSSNIFINKLNPAGNFMWVRNMGGIAGDSDFGLSIAADSKGGIYTTGFFQGSVDFDTGPGTNILSSAGSSDLFLHKIDSSGNYKWTKRIGGTEWESGMSISIDQKDDLVMTGYFSDSVGVDFDPGPGTFTMSTQPNYDDAFICSIDTSGSFKWAVQLTGGDTRGNSIVADNAGNYYSTGDFYGTTDFDFGPSSYTLATIWSQDMYIHKISMCTNPQAPQSTTPNSSMFVCTGASAVLTATSAGSISWYAFPSQSVAIGTGTSLVTPTLTSGTHSFYAVTGNSCNATAQTAITVQATSCAGLGIIEEKTAITIIPNPCNGNFRINHNLSGNNNCLYIYDLMGRIVDQKILGTEHYEFEIAGVSPGIYIVVVESETEKLSVKLIVN